MFSHMTASLYRPRRQQHPSQGHAPQFMAQNIFQMSSFYGRKMKMKMKKLQYSQVPSYVTLCLVQRLEIACNCIELEVVCLKIFPTWKLKMYWKHIFSHFAASKSDYVGIWQIVDTALYCYNFLPHFVP